MFEEIEVARQEIQSFTMEREELMRDFDSMLKGKQVWPFAYFVFRFIQFILAWD